MDTGAIRKKLDRLVAVDEWEIRDFQWLVRTTYDLLDGYEAAMKGLKKNGGGGKISVKKQKRNWREVGCIGAILLFVIVFGFLALWGGAR